MHVCSQWMKRMASFIKAKRDANNSSITTIKGDTAARMIADSANSHVEEAVFDSIDASRHGLKLGDQVAVTPEDNGKLLVVVHVQWNLSLMIHSATNYSTIGKLIGFDHEQVVIELGGSAVPTLRCHFPRFNYGIVKVSPVTSSKL